MPIPPRPKPHQPLEPAEDLLGATARMLAALFAEPVQETTSLQSVFKALMAPKARVVVELPWYPDGGKHQLVLVARDGTRLRFYNPLGHGTRPAGTELTDGLRRRIELDGTESCELAALETLFRMGKARALISHMPA